MLDKNPITSLIAKAQNGDREAFDDLVSRTIDGLRDAIDGRIGIGLRQRISPDDVLQETYARALQSIGKFKLYDEGSFERWLRGIAENLIRDEAKRQKHAPKIMLDRDPPAGGASPSKVFRRHQRFDRLESALEQLSPDHREVIMLARIDGLSMREIAERMDRTTGAVKALLLRAMRELKNSFGNTESLHLPNRSLSEPKHEEE